MKNLLHLLQRVFHRETPVTRLMVTRNNVTGKGELQVQLPIYTEKQVSKIISTELLIYKMCTGTNIEVITFATFFIEIFPEAAHLPFKTLCKLWVYYHEMHCNVTKGNMDWYHSFRNGPYYAAIDIAIIASYATSQVIINKSPQSEAPLSFRICKRALTLAELDGVHVCIIKCKADEYAFHMCNNKQMFLYERITPYI